MDSMEMLAIGKCLISGAGGSSSQSFGQGVFADHRSLFRGFASRGRRRRPHTSSPYFQGSRVQQHRTWSHKFFCSSSQLEFKTAKPVGNSKVVALDLVFAVLDFITATAFKGAKSTRHYKSRLLLLSSLQ